MHVVHARADAREAVVRAADQARHHHRVRALGADRRAVLAVARDVEHRPALGLQRERLADEPLAARVVDARRQRSAGARVRAAVSRRGHARRAIRRHAAGVGLRLGHVDVQPSSDATPARSSSSSFSVAFIRSREKSSIGRSRTQRVLAVGGGHRHAVHARPAGCRSCRPTGCPSSPTCRWLPSIQSRTWSIAALAADAADDRPRASMIAAPRLPTLGRNVVAVPASSLIERP